MDTFTVLYALIFAAAFMAILSIGLRATYRLIMSPVRRAPHRGAGLNLIDPFEPADTRLMHCDPRML